MMADKYKGEVRKLYKTWAEYGEDGYTKDEVDALREMQEQLSEAVLARETVWRISSGGTHPKTLIPNPLPRIFHHHEPGNR